MIALNVGSGQRPFKKPFVNIDPQERWNPDVVADGAHLPYADASIDLVVYSHVWEHEGCGEALALQREAFRILKPGGSLIVSVPDTRALAQAWLVGKLDTVTYMISTYGAFMGHDRDRHRWGFTKETLEMELADCSWREVKMFDWRKVEGMDLARDFWILAMEAVR